jgi:hypothetical protein
VYCIAKLTIIHKNDLLSTIDMELQLLCPVNQNPNAAEPMIKYAPPSDQQQDASLCSIQLHPNSLHPSKPTTSTFPFMNLPKELRLEVYSYLSNQVLEPVDIGSPKRFGYWSVVRYQALPLVCRSIYDEVMDTMYGVNDKQPATVFCLPDEHHNHRALQLALKRGYTIDHEKRNSTGDAYVISEAVDAGMHTLLTKVPYSPYINDIELALRIRKLRTFLAHTFMRLRRDPVIYLTLVVRERGYKRFYNWYGSERAERAVRWYTRDALLAWHLCDKLRRAGNAERKEYMHVQTESRVVGEQGDSAFESFWNLLIRRAGEGDVVCEPLGGMGYKDLPAKLVYR